ncbi:MAG: phage holin family protein [Muribaculaceae bacterium]|nr:phage holin family protein [Muribaculaceae bacterium]
MSHLAKRLLRLKVENAKLMATEKLTILFENILFAMLIFLLGICCMGFIAVGIVHFLSEIMEPGWAYLIVAGLYLIVIILVVRFRHQLIGNPLARLISRLIIDEPKDFSK